jgi:cell division protein FtsB
MRDTTPRRILRTGRSLPDAFVKQVLLWVILALSAATVIVLLGGAVARADAEAQVAAARAENVALQQTIEQTMRAIATAKSDVEIERVARRWGYVRPGDHPIVIVNGSAK